MLCIKHAIFDRDSSFTATFSVQQVHSNTCEDLNILQRIHFIAN